MSQPMRWVCVVSFLELLLSRTSLTIGGVACDWNGASRDTLQRHITYFQDRR
jgi:hypothetical protein